MAIARTLTKGVAVATLLLLVAAPAGAATGDTTRGTAATTSVPLHVEALGVPVDLGRTVLSATTDTDTVATAPWSAVSLTLLDVAGETFGEVGVASDGDTSSEGSSADRDLPLGSVGASVGDLLAIADDTAGSATASLTALTTEATILEALNLSATITDAVATVDDTGAASTHALRVAGIDLDLAHLLGGVLGTLPLQDLIDIADTLGVAVPVDLSSADGVVTATEELLTAVSDAALAATAVETTAGALLTADAGTLAALQDLVTRVESLSLLSPTLTTDLQAILNDADFPADCDVSLTGLLVSQTLLDSIVTCLQGEVTEHLAGLTGELGALEAAVTTYLAAVSAATDAASALSTESSTLSDIVGQIETLLADLLAADLVAVGPLEISQQVQAIGGQLDASSATHTCEVTTITALGGDPVEVADCDGGATALTAAVETVTAALTAVLDTVGGVDAGDGVTLELFGTVQDTVSEDADGTVRATSIMEVLALTVPDITISACDVADGLVCALGIDLDGALDTALDGVDGVLNTAHATVTTALASVSPLLSALGSTLDVSGAGGAQQIVDDAIAVLEGVLATLDLGDLGTGGGIVVPGARVVVDPELAADHQVIAAGAPGNPTAPAPDPSDPPLPNTGGGAALVAVLALGSGAWLWRRREVS